MSYSVSYELVRPSFADNQRLNTCADRMSVIATLNRIALAAGEQIVLMMRNTGLLVKAARLEHVTDVLAYLHGDYGEEPRRGDRGDIYRRKLAEQIHVNHAVDGVTHNNVTSVVEAAIILERETRGVLVNSAKWRHTAPSVDIDETIFDILSRIANVF